MIQIALFVPQTDIAYYYNAVSTNNGPFGDSRQLSLNLTAQAKGTIDVSNSLWKEFTPDGHVIAYPVDTNGNVTSISWRQDAVGNRHSFSYSAGLLSTLQDSVGRFVSFSCSGGLLQSIQDWANRRTTFRYDTVSASPKNVLTNVTRPTG